MYITTGFSFKIQAVLIGTMHDSLIPYCAWDFTVKFPEHRHPVILLGHIPVGVVQEGGLSHDLLLVIAESNGKVCLLPVEVIKITHINKITESEMRMSFFSPFGY